MPISEEQFKQLSEKGRIIGRQDPNSITGRAFAILKTNVAMTADEVINIMAENDGYAPKKTVKRVLNNLCKNLVRVKSSKIKKAIKKYMIQEGKGVAYFMVNPEYVHALEKDNMEEQLKAENGKKKKKRKRPKAKKRKKKK